jgi:hypothetical protein
MVVETASWNASCDDGSSVHNALTGSQVSNRLKIKRIYPQLYSQNAQDASHERAFEIIDDFFHEH